MSLSKSDRPDWLGLSRPGTGLGPLSRRGVLGGASLALLTPAMLGRTAEAVAPVPRWSDPTPAQLQAALPALALPMLGDGTNLDRPEYYRTLQSGRRRGPRTLQGADLNGDGSDELIVRTQGGIQAYTYSPKWGQWLDLVGLGPRWADATGWNAEQFYTTIQTADLDGDGRAELLARGPDGVEVWRYLPEADDTAPHWVRLDLPAQPLLDDETWNHPRYYSTMQCADIDGDGKAEIIVRSPTGLRSWGIRRAADGGWEWRQDVTGSSGPASDAGGWDQEDYYGTIQCGRVRSGQVAVLGRASNGMLAWTFDPVIRRWSESAPLGDTADALGWGERSRWGTLQLADIDGDGVDELLGLDDTGLRSWRLTDVGWASLGTFADLGAASGWTNSNYALSLQTADLDGDGRAELFGLGSEAMYVYRYAPGPGGGPGTWTDAGQGPPWGQDTTPFGQVQHEQTVQAPRIANQPSPIVGRSPQAVETWRYTGTEAVRASASFPPIDSAVLRYVSKQLYGDSRDPNGPRGQYNNLDRKWDSFLVALATMRRPRFLGKSEWSAVRKQLELEFRWVTNVQTHFALALQVYDEIMARNEASLRWLADDLGLPEEKSKASWIIDVVSLVTDIVAAVASFAGPIGQVIGKVADGIEKVAALISAVTLAASEGIEHGSGEPNTLQGNLVYLDEQINNLWDASQAMMTLMPGAICGGNNGGQYVPGDYGLLAAIGQQIETGSVPQWAWTSETVQTVGLGATQGFAAHGYATLAYALPWRWRTVLFYKDYPDCHSTTPSGPVEGDTYEAQLWNKGYYWWPIRRYNSTECYQYYLAEEGKKPIRTDLLDNLFGERSTSTVVPLGVDPMVVLRGTDGWPQFERALDNELFGGAVTAGCCGPSEDTFPAPWEIPAPTDPAADGVGTLTTDGAAPGGVVAGSPYLSGRTRRVPKRDLGVLPVLTRRPDRGLDLRLEITDRGRLGTNDLVVRQVSLGAVVAAHGLPSARMRVDRGATVTHHLTFPRDRRLRRGSVLRLRVTMTHANGRHTETVRVKLP